MEKSNQGYAVQMKNVSKKFGNFYANKSVNLDVKKGEIHAILGENGAGKSTLMNLLFGIYNLDQGEIYINEQKVAIKTPNDATKYKISMVHQHFKLVETFTVLENITLGNEKTKRFGKIDYQSATSKLNKLIKTYNFDIDLNKKISHLEVGEQQKVEILKMLYKDSEIFIFDEPTGALTPNEAIELIKIINLLKQKGKTVIIITHKLNEIKQVADRCTIIKKGTTIDTVDVASTTQLQLAKKMVGRDISFDVKKTPYNPQAKVLTLKNIFVEKENISTLKNCSFDIHEGEILGIAGVEGNGQTEIIDAINGELNYTGDIFFYNNNINNLNIKERINLNIGNIPSDRQKHGIIPDFTLYENIGIKYKSKYLKKGIISYQQMQQDTQKLLSKYDVRTPDSIYTSARDLSGGNQQKLIIAREISNNPKLLIANKPTRGVDIGAIENIHNIILKCRQNNMAILLTSLELDEVLKLSDRVIVMHGGEVMGIVNPNSTTREQVGLMMAGKRLDEN